MIYHFSKIEIFNENINIRITSKFLNKMNNNMAIIRKQLIGANRRG